MRYLFVIAPLFLTQCTAGPGFIQPEFAASEVIERAGGAEETPAWASGATPFILDGADLTYVNTISMSGNARPEACSRAAAETGRVQIMRQIKDNITSSGQFSEVSASSDPAVETLVAFLSQGQLSGARVTARYWEKREESDESGLRVLRLHCAVKVSIKKSLLESQLRAAISGNGSGNPEIRQKLLEAQKQFLDNVSTPPQAEPEAKVGAL